MSRFTPLLFVALALAAAFVPPAAADNTSLRKPYNFTGELTWFKSAGSADPSLDTTYILQVATPGIVIVSFGIIAFVTFLWWSCCGCSCCPCCKKENEVDCFCLSEGHAKFLYVVMALLCTGAVIGCAIYGLEVNKSQEAGFRALGPAGVALGGWTTDIVADCNSQTAALNAAIVVIDAAPLSTDGGSSANVDILIATMNGLVTQIANLEKAATNLNLESYSGSVDKIIDPVNEYRELALLITLGVLLGVIILQLLFAILNLFAPDSLKPNECCIGQVLQGTVTAIFMIAFFLSWLLFGLMVSITAVPADICSDPVSVLGIATSTSPDFAYFINCSSMTPAEQEAQNPFKTELDVISTGNQAIADQWATVKSSKSGSGPAYDTQIANGDAAVANIDLTEIVSFAQCDSLNELWNIIANTLCGTVGESLAKTTVLVGAIAIIMLLAEPIRRKLNEIYLDEQDKTV